jgi:hypothetical protein
MRQTIREFPAFRVNGFAVLLVVVAIAILGSWWIFSRVQGLEALLGRGLKVTDFIDEGTAELQARLEVAGVEVIEARLSHLAYAPEIAQMMLRRQQAKALIDARRQIVEGAVGMVNEALNRLNESQMLDLDDERKAAMINNLLVVLTSEQTAQPVVNTGSLYN